MANASVELVSLPSCPAILAQLTQTLQDPNSTIADFARCISVDAPLTLRVLRAVNSAYYGLSRKVTSVEDAAFRLGSDGIYSLAVGMQIKDLYASALKNWGTLKDDLWKHSLRVAILAKVIGKEKKSAKPDEMFTAGVLHDCGKLALLVSKGDPYSAMLLDIQNFGTVLEANEMQAFGTKHSWLGRDLAKKWELPQDLQALIERHHDPRADGEIRSDWATLSTADALVHAAVPFGTEGMVRLDFKHAQISKDAIEKLGFTMQECIRMTTEALRISAELEGQFQ